MTHTLILFFVVISSYALTQEREAKRSDIGVQSIYYHQSSLNIVLKNHGHKPLRKSVSFQIKANGNLRYWTIQTPLAGQVTTLKILAKDLKLQEGQLALVQVHVDTLNLLREHNVKNNRNRQRLYLIPPKKLGAIRSVSSKNGFTNR